MTLLTTKDIQDLIHVDKSTIYRMAEDGRLPAIKVGRQWRFPADRVAELLGEGLPVSKGDATATRERLSDLIEPAVAQAVADLVADLFGVMVVMTDMDGSPLTAVSNPCGLFDTIQHQPGAVQRCVDGWRELGDAAGLGVRLMPSHLGFLCARSFVRVGSELVGMIIVGGITPPSWPPSLDRIHQVADDLGIPHAELAAHAEETYDLDEEQQTRLVEVLPKLSDLISSLAATRSRTNNVIDAALTGAAPTERRSTT
jgi:excisionase family DNA binding protein